MKGFPLVSRALGRGVSWLLLAALSAYRLVVSPLLGNACRYEPSCSRYTSEAIAAHGAVRGVWLGLRRLGRCHPLAAGGYDPVP